MGGHLTEGWIPWVNVEVVLAEVEMRGMIHDERKTSGLFISPKRFKPNL